MNEKDPAKQLAEYRSKRVLITGHTGFKGSWLSLWLEMLGATVSGFALAPETEPNHFSLLSLKGESTIGSIEDYQALLACVQKCQPEIVFHLAAQPLVRASYTSPRETFETNCMGTVNLFEAVRQVDSVKALVCITTDKVYQQNETEQGSASTVFREGDRLGGADPYSASKACVELICESYRQSFFENSACLLAVARSGNVFAGGDWSVDRLIPDVVRSVYSKQPLLIRYPTAIRPWQHVLDPLYGYLLLGASVLQGDTQAAKAYNFGPEAPSHIQVEQLLQLAQSHWPDIRYHIEEESLLHEAAKLRLDSTLAQQELGWKPLWGIEESVARSIRWYKEFYQDKKVLSVSDIEAYSDQLGSGR